MNATTQPFYIVTRESGSLRDDLPLWGSHQENPLQLDPQSSNSVTKQIVEGVPGAFQLLNVLSSTGCLAFLNATESMGYTEDAAVSLGRNIRHNLNLNWIIDDTTAQILWERVAVAFGQDHSHFLGYTPLGLNQRFRFYRYETGDFFSFHSDGSWPGSRIIDGQVVTDAFGDRYSLYTFLIFLDEDFEGGETQFLVNPDGSNQPARNPNNAEIAEIRTPQGGVLCFPHGTHPLHCLHGSASINSGVKNIIRTDVLFSL